MYIPEELDMHSDPWGRERNVVVDPRSTHRKTIPSPASSGRCIVTSLGCSHRHCSNFLHQLQIGATRFGPTSRGAAVSNKCRGPVHRIRTRICRSSTSHNNVGSEIGGQLKAFSPFLRIRPTAEPQRTEVTIRSISGITLLEFCPERANLESAFPSKPTGLVLNQRKALPSAAAHSSR